MDSRLLVVVAVSAGVSGVSLASAAEPDPGSFVARFLADVPQPAPGQFPTPESVVAAFISAVNANDVDGAMRCFPIRERYHASDIDVSYRFTGGWVFMQSPPPPGVDDHLWALQVAWNEFTRPWTFLRVMAYAPEVERVVGTERKLFEGDPDARARFDALKSIKATARYHVSVVDMKDGPLNVLETAMGAQEKRVFALSGGIGDFSFSAQLSWGAAVKIGSNWRLESLVLK